MIIKQRPAFRKLFNQRGIPGKDEATAFILQQGQMVKISVRPGTLYVSSSDYKGQYGTACVWIMGCKTRDLVSWCWFIAFVHFTLYFASGKKKSSTLDGKVGKAWSGCRSCEAHPVLKAAGLIPGLDFFEVELTGRDSVLSEKPTRGKTEKESLHAKWAAPLEVQPFHLKGIRVSSGSNECSLTAVAQKPLKGMPRTDLLLIDWFGLFLQMPRKLTCSSYTVSELVSNTWHYYMGDRSPYPLPLHYFSFNFWLAGIKIFTSIGYVLGWLLQLPGY